MIAIVVYSFLEKEKLDGALSADPFQSCNGGNDFENNVRWSSRAEEVHEPRISQLQVWPLSCSVFLRSDFQLYCTRNKDPTLDVSTAVHLSLLTIHPISKRDSE